ncbi:MAG TPA: ribose-5-phosphate isomerase RpiA [Bryobacteraceae bacterium]|jgi:ribose 5-phosphate isomerase A|nr:ribose-5-phosphate isomerase RpiA [Bryobacteraceae bacterium]
MPTQDELKAVAANEAARLVADGMIVGLGSGSTASLAVEAIGRRVAEGLSITGVPTSQKTAELASRLHIPLLTLDECDEIDVTIDGADEVERDTLNVIKGRGGALLREKLVASATRKLVLIVDESKVVDRLCPEEQAIPVEIERFGWRGTAGRLTALGAKWTQRMTNDRQPFVTDGGHFILDCTFPPFDAVEVDRLLNNVVGVVEHGLFIGMAKEVIVARNNGQDTTKSEILHLRPSR